MENYENLVDELTRLLIQKQAVVKQIHEVEAQLNKIKEEKAVDLYNEIRNKISELEKLGYHFEVQVWNNDCGIFDWYNIGNSPTFRYRHADTVIVD